MKFDPITKRALIYSSVLHLAGLLFLILAALFSTLWAQEEEPYIFEMVELPDPDRILVPEPSLPEPEPVPEPEPELPEPEPEPEPVPEPEPEPVPEPEPEPEPVPEPVEEPPPPPVEEPPPPPPPPPKPVEKPPPPKPVEKPPPPKPVEKPPPPPEKPKPKIISYDDFVKRVGAPETPKTIPAKPKKAPKIDTSRIERNLRQSIMSVPELSVSTPSSSAQTDEMLAWRRLLAARLDQEWKKTNTSGTVGRSARVQFHVSAGGAISNVRVISSSGFADLDKNAILTVRSLGIFQPPPNRQGVTITVTFKVE